jgi:hypothetical protein
MALFPCRECGRMVSTEAYACPQCGCPEPTRTPPGPAAPQEPLPPASASPPSAPGVPVVDAGTEPAVPAGSTAESCAESAVSTAESAESSRTAGSGSKETDATGRVAKNARIWAPPGFSRDAVGEDAPPTARTALFILGAFGVALVLVWTVGVRAVGGDRDPELLLLLAAAGVLLWTPVELMNHTRTGFLLTAGVWLVVAAGAVARLVEAPREWMWPVLAIGAALLMFDYLWSYRAWLRTPATAEFEAALKPFAVAGFLPGGARQNAALELNNQIVLAGSVRGVDPSARARIETKHGVSFPADLPRESQAVYARYLKHFLASGALGPEQEAELAALQALLALPEHQATHARARVGTTLLRERTKEALADKRLDPAERAELERDAGTLGVKLDLDEEERRARGGR